MRKWEYSLEYHILIPSGEADVMLFTPPVREALAPGLLLTREELELLIWRGRCRDRRINERG